MDHILTVDTPAGPRQISGYHAHVYFVNEDEARRAALLRDRVTKSFPRVRVGRWHHEPVGPHSQPMYQVAFAVEQLADFLPWLLLNRMGLSVLVHPQSENAYEDHAENALWLGRALPLHLDVLRRRHHN